VGIDGLSQSSGNLGPNFLNNRIAGLTRKKGELIQTIKGHYSRSFLIDSF
jgi:hypothetical protein